MIKIDKKIISQEVVKKGTNKKPVNTLKKRPEILHGSTYKIETPLSEHALYVTINDIVINGQKYPFEIFLNSKNMEHFQWTVAMTRIISAIFRHGGEVVFLIDELKSVFDPNGGYFKKGGKYMPSLVAEIGEVINSHFVMIGLIEKPELDEHQKKLIEKAKEKLNNEFPDTATICKKCNTKAVVLLDGCSTCLSCADSKCG